MKALIPGPSWQRGSLTQYESKRNGTIWRGRFRVWTSQGKRREASIKLGKTSEVSEAEARASLDAVVGKVNQEIGYVKHFGLRGTLAQFRKPGRIKVNSNRSKGHLRGATGVASEFLVCADLLSKGIEVYRPLNPQSEFDLLCLIDGDPVRVEVKTSAPRGSKEAFKLTGREGSFDVLAIVNREGAIRYEVNHAIESNSRVAAFGGAVQNEDGKVAGERYGTSQVIVKS